MRKDLSLQLCGVKSVRITMKLLKSCLAVLVMAVLSAGPSFGAVAAGVLSSTTLNGAINATQTTLVLASASASSGSTLGAPAVGHCLFVDLELMRITAVSSTTMTVQRASRGRAPHATSAVIITGPCSAGGQFGGFRQTDPPLVVGNQDCSVWVNPWVNTNTGDTWWCDHVTSVVSVTNPIARNGTAGSRRVAQ
jgi:hypothetical protein